MDIGEESEQVGIAVEIILGMLKMLAEGPGSIPLDYLPNYLRMAANERERHGDFGASRLLEIWANSIQNTEGFPQTSHKQYKETSDD